MDALLANLGAHALNYAIRSGIALTSTYAIGQCSRLLKTVDDLGLHAELKKQLELLDNKIKIISPSIGLIELQAGRGNTPLDSAVPLTKSLHRDIVSLGKRLERVATVHELSRQGGLISNSGGNHTSSLLDVIKDVKSLLDRIDRDVPLLQLAITSSGANVKTSMPPGISPSRLLQASTFLIIGDTQYAKDPSRSVQIGPTFTLSLYMLFEAHTSCQSTSSAKPPNENGQIGELNSRSYEPSNLSEHDHSPANEDRKPLWQEVIHKARVRLCRTPYNHVFDVNNGYRPATKDDHVSLSPIWPTDAQSSDPALDSLSKFAYHLEMIEDLDDGRMHDDRGVTELGFDNMTRAGIRESIPVQQLSKIFYTDTGRMLNIRSALDGDSKPILLFKRDFMSAPPIRRNESNGIANRKVLNERRVGVNGEGLLEGQSDSESHLHSDSDSYAQSDVDQQLLLESEPSSSLLRQRSSATLNDSYDELRFPRHLNPEWIALEAFEDAEENDEDDGDDDDSDHSFSHANTSHSNHGQAKNRPTSRHRSSIDPRLASQIENLTFGTAQFPVAETSISRLSLTVGADGLGGVRSNQESFMARSPFGAITSSLSLLEMLIRLTSLQEFQQASHLSIPDQVLTFFLEETSTTGLRGEARWRARNEAKRQVGFDPFANSPTNSSPSSPMK